MRPYFLSRVRRKGKPYGFKISRYDDPTGVECPRPQCNKIVVYNGNYFCECGWAAPDIRLQKDEQEYIDSLYAGLMAFRDKRKNKEVKIYE